MFSTNPVLLKTLLDNVAIGKIQLPDFQRGWVWDDDRIRGLLASISRRFPIGAVMTLSSGGDINFKARLIEGVGEGSTGAAAGAPSSFLLDGQQRLTSLYQALLHPGPVRTQNSRRQRIDRWYYVDMLKAMDPYVDREEAIISVPEDKRITQNFGRETVLDLSTTELEYQNHMMPTEQLLDGMSWMFAYNMYWSVKDDHPRGNVAAFVNDFNQSTLNAFTQYLLPVIDLDKETPKEAVCTVFEKVNTGGVTLTVFELVTASFAADAGTEHFSLREDWDARKDVLYSRAGVLQGIEGPHFLQAVALLTTQERRRQELLGGKEPSQAPAISCKRGDILRLSLDDYKRWADKLVEGFIAAADFLKHQHVFTRWDVPYNTQLVPLAALFVELGKELEPANAKARLERWYWSGVFGEVYGGNTETQFALDVQEVAEHVRGGNQPRLITEANFIPERLLSLRTRNSAAYKGLYALQKKSAAADWRTGYALALAHDSSIDIHHIFPVYWCQNAKPPVPWNLYDSVINKTPIDATTNRIIGGKSPSAYLPRLRRDMPSEKLDQSEKCTKQQQKLNQVLETHWINPKWLWANDSIEGKNSAEAGDSAKGDNFAEFFVERGEAMLQLIGKAMGKPMPSGQEVFRGALRSAGLWEQAEQESEDHSLGLTPVEEFDDTDVEYDPVGSAAYDNEGEVAA